MPSDTPTPAAILAAHDYIAGVSSCPCGWHWTETRTYACGEDLRIARAYNDHLIAALAEHYHLLPKVEAHRMRVGLIDMAPEDEMFPGDEPVLTVRFSADIPQPGRLFDLDELAAALMAAHVASSEWRQETPHV